MAKTGRKMAGIAMAGALLLAPRYVTAADAEADVAASFPHVRTTSPAIVAVIQRATEASVTFRGLIDTINASDSVVYVEEGECSQPVRACFTSVTVAGRYRLMWVTVDTRKADWDLMGSIGHELRHTIEVIDSPSIRSNADKYFLYRRIGIQAFGGTLETQTAIDAGDAVRSEVRKFNRQAKSR